MDTGKSSRKEVISAQEAEDLKMKEKRKREREVGSVPQCRFVFRFVCVMKCTILCCYLFN